MRIRTSTSASALAAALLLTALAAPSAGAVPDLVPTGAGGGHPPGYSNPALNNGKPVVIGLGVARFPTAFDIDDRNGGVHNTAMIWHGWGYDDRENVFYAEGVENCAGQMRCKGTFHVNHKYVKNSQAGIWHLTLAGSIPDGPGTLLKSTLRFSVLRKTALTVNAAPEPVRKGGTVGVSGRLTAADWERGRYTGLQSRKKVQLEFRAAGSGTYRTVGRAYPDRYGKVAFKAKAAADGYWRLRYPGDTTTAPVLTYGDFVDVR
ncbi:hypothetical protein [Streptomyces tsukubensis]|uniref:hypothetical protein n=1 Tax=Streptomyces tsukubensis TaxID=83656 RepID=UPI0034505999